LLLRHTQFIYGRVDALYRVQSPAQFPTRCSLDTSSREFVKRSGLQQTLTTHRQLRSMQVGARDFFYGCRTACKGLCSASERFEAAFVHLSASASILPPLACHSEQGMVSSQLGSRRSSWASAGNTSPRAPHSTTLSHSS
jgi:hypothetical protein